MHCRLKILSATKINYLGNGNAHAPAVSLTSFSLPIQVVLNLSETFVKLNQIFQMAREESNNITPSLYFPVFLPVTAFHMCQFKNCPAYHGLIHCGGSTVSGRASRALADSLSTSAWLTNSLFCLTQYESIPEGGIPVHSSNISENRPKLTCFAT